MKTLHQALLDVRQRFANQTLDTSAGICDNLFQVYSDIEIFDYQELELLIEDWPEFSGNTDFPVPHPNLSPEDAFTAALVSEMWYEGEYAAARVRLLDYLIEATK